MTQTKNEAFAVIDRALDNLEQAIGSLRGDPTRSQVYTRMQDAARAAQPHEPAALYP